MINIANLNAGIGDPWAGQIKANAEPCWGFNTLIFWFCSLGAALPMGSKSSQKSQLTHLNPGKGIPCAGQRKAKVAVAGDIITEILSFMLTLGAELPTGSE